MRFRRSLLTVLACLAVAAPAASARPVEQFLDPSSSCEAQWVAVYHTPAPSSCEQQVLASRSSGAPAAAAAETSHSPSLPSPDGGFDVGSAVAGAGAAAVMALLIWSVPVLTRRRVRTARS